MKSRWHNLNAEYRGFPAKTFVPPLPSGNSKTKSEITFIHSPASCSQCATLVVGVVVIRMSLGNSKGPNTENNSAYAEFALAFLIQTST